MNPLELTPFEHRMLGHCLTDDPRRTRRRIVSVVVAALVFAGLLVFASFKLSKPVLVAIALAYVFITTIEKVLYGFGVMGYKGIIRKLYARLHADDAGSGT